MQLGRVNELREPLSEDLTLYLTAYPASEAQLHVCIR